MTNPTGLKTEDYPGELEMLRAVVRAVRVTLPRGDLEYLRDALRYFDLDAAQKSGKQRLRKGDTGVLLPVSVLKMLLKAYSEDREPESPTKD